MLCWAANVVEVYNKEVSLGSKIVKGEGWMMWTN